MNETNEIGFYRLNQIIGDAKANPPIEGIIPVSKSTWFSGVKSGKFPKPVSLGPRMSGYRKKSIHELVRRLQGEDSPV